MQSAFEFSIAVRKKIIQLIENLSLEQLNFIPEGFNNNLAWNFGHIVNTTEALAYIASGVNPLLTIPFKEDYGKGSKPLRHINSEEINHFKERAFTSIEKVKNDIINGKISDVTPYVTETFGMSNDSPESIMQCIAMHDSYHYGCMRTLLQKIKS